MKKTLIALTALGACTMASAQSSVTIFGIIDAAVERVHNSGGASVNRLINSGWSTSRLGFRGTEDLGGGLSAGFWLEAGLSNDDGRGAATNINNQPSGGAVPGLGGGQGLAFGRRSTVSLAGPWGEVRLGRDYIPGIFNIVLYDPFGNIGVGASQSFNTAITGVTLLRASNSVGYHTPTNMGGFFGSVMYWMGENPSGTATHDDGTGYGARVGYRAGPAEIAVSLNRTQYLAGDVRQDNVGGNWDFGVAKLMGSLSRDRNGATRARGGEIGVIVPVGAGEIKAAYSRYNIHTPTLNPESSKVAVGYGHNLSKRTTVYGAYARVRNSGGSTATVSFGAPAAVANGASSGVNLGIRHSF